MEPKESCERIITASTLAFTALIPNSALVQYIPEIAEKESSYSQGTECSYEIDSDLIDIEEPYPYEKLEIKNLSDFKVESVEMIKKDPVFTVTKETPLYLIPFDTGFESKKPKEVKVASLLPGLDVQLAQTRILRNSDGDTVKVGLLANTYGGPYVAAIVLTSKFDGKLQHFVASNRSESVVSTYIGTENDQYPNKIANIIRALRNISEYQDSNGPFRYGRDYSQINLLGLDDEVTLNEYKSGYSSVGESFPGGGVCATVTGVSSLFTNLSREIVVKERHLHSSPYAQGPFSSAYTDADATVFVHPNPQYIKDYVWSIKRPNAKKYLRFDIDLIPSRIPYDKNNALGLRGPSDAVIIVSYSLSNEKPEYQTELLELYMKEYELYRTSEFKDELPGGRRAIEYKKFPLSADMIKLSKLIYDPDWSY